MAEVRILELPDHPFFVATLFVPQARSTEREPHPLVTAFVVAAREISSRVAPPTPERTAGHRRSQAAGGTVNP